MVADFFQHRFLIVHVLLMLQVDELWDAHHLQSEEVLGLVLLDQLHRSEQPSVHCSQSVEVPQVVGGRF